MKRTHAPRAMTVKASMFAAGLFALCSQLPLASAANMSHEQYSAAKDQISAAYKSDKAACDGMSGNAKDVCVEQAKGKEKVAKAELEYKYTGKESDRNDIAKVRADADYSVAKERCDDKSGNDKDVCVTQAKAAREHAMADAKLSRKTTDARQDAMADKRDADYKVAIEKCDSMSGGAKDQCVADAKSRFGKG